MTDRYFAGTATAVSDAKVFRFQSECTTAEGKSFLVRYIASRWNFKSLVRIR